LQTEQNPSGFHLIEPAPEHIWITLTGRGVVPNEIRLRSLLEK
jgi:hypothetical protein